MNRDSVKRVCEFYAITHKLKTLTRKGWEQWGIETDRVESVAEHIYGTMMLAFAINSEFGLGLNIEKLMYMLAFHELGECVVGDITPVDGITREEKEKRELLAISEILSGIKDAESVKEISLEYNQKTSKEAVFAKWVDKLECDFQCKYYEEKGCNNINFQRQNLARERIRQNGLKKGYKTLAEMWLNYDKDNFLDNEIYQVFIKQLLEEDVFKE